ncbi:autophagy protein 6 [Cerrena zonata]|uniref:Autophagy protein 6 n=1 Tax=Cerrena zonata TaxID=2478898 RepID=A0AAW0FAY3_9APHY
MGSKSQIVKVTYSYNQGDNTDPNPSDADALNEAGTLSNQTQQQKLLKSKTILNLYSSNEFSLGKLFNFNKLDVSMIALLDILYQIGKKLSTINQEIELPYGISKRRDSIGGKSIRVTSNGEWTHSCKFLLTNLNWILAYASAHPSPSST